jgi:hypothetical protein
VAQAVIPAVRRLRQEDLEFKAKLGYIIDLSQIYICVYIYIHICMCVCVYVCLSILHDLDGHFIA